MKGYLITIHFGGGAGFNLYIVRAFTEKGAKDKLSASIGSYALIGCSVRELDKKPVELIYEHTDENYEG